VSKPAESVLTAFNAHRRFLWSLSYRLTGNAADADDAVQETFVRALAHPPARPHDPWRPWLVRVALNVGRDLLRRRRRRRYEGPWLPSPIETGDDPPSFEPGSAIPSPAARYDLLESVSFAFLLALEALTPAQRAVLLLRDVFDYSVRETGKALAMSEANVKTTHLRARRAMASYDHGRRPPSPEADEATRRALQRFLSCLMSGDVAGFESLLARDVRMTSDGGGEFAAALRPVLGRERVTRFYASLAARGRSLGLPAPAIDRRRLNGLPSLVLRFGPLPKPYAPVLVLQCRLDADGRIAEVWNVSASAKLRGLPAMGL
jgi:RNA polymerase sigma-70 factor (ECF subfamily)